MTNEGVFIEVDEDDPFEGVKLQAVTEDGVGIEIGKIMKGSGRYELRKVDQ